MNFSAFNPFAPFRQLYRHRTLLGQFAQRTIEQRHRASFLGLLWAVLSPLFSLTIYTLVFGYIFNGRFNPEDPNETNLDYALGIFLGLILFNFLSEVLNASPSTIVSQPNFVKKVVFPLEILPAAPVAAAGFSGVISLVMGLVGVSAFGDGLDWHAFQLFLIIPPVVLLAFGSAWFLSAFSVFVRDTASAMPFLVHILVYMSAVFYPMRLLEKLPEWGHRIVLANPLLHAVESVRRAVLWHLPVSPGSMLYLWLAGGLAFAMGYYFFHKTRAAFADVL